MFRRVVLSLVMTFLIGSLVYSMDTRVLQHGFTDPPLSARPRAYWVWLNGNFDYSQLTKDLENIKEKGLGGFDIFDIGARDPENVVPEGHAFFGPESVEGIAYAIRETQRLGLELGLITSSSWNAGGPWVPPELGTMGLFVSEMEVDGPAKLSQKIPLPKFPQKAPQNDDGLPVFNKTVAVLALPYSETKTVEDNNSILDLTDRLQGDSKLEWDVPAGKWIIYRYVCACTGERLVLPSPKSDGLIIDHFNPEATEFHFRYLLEELEDEMGSVHDTGLKIMYLPSYEVTSYDDYTGLIWTPMLQEEFLLRRGYSLTPFLPALFGWTIRDADYTDRFQFDFKMTLSDLIIENHYAKAREVSNEYGLLLCSEAGGPGQPLHNCPFEALRALGTLDIPRGEFWYKHQRFDEEGNDIMWLVKEIACASHIYGKTLVDGEAFTSWHHWQIGPFDLKPLADRAMCGGLNRFTYHTSPHCPPEAGEPGWVYHAGTHMGSTRAWWPKSRSFNDYLARCCFLLQQGKFAADVLYYYGDEAPNFVKPKHVDPSLGYGYDYDVVNTEVILTRLEVKDGRLVLPDGMRYELLVLPERDDMNFEVLQKIDELVKAGATVVGPKPIRENGLTNYPHCDEQVRQLANRVWGDCDGKQVKERSYGSGKIVWGKRLQDILMEKNIGPAFQCSPTKKETDVDWIHRRTDEEEIFFIYNKNQEWLNLGCTFRVKDKIPEFWYPDTGEMRPCAVYKTVDSGIQIPITLPPAGSLFVVFREGKEVDHLVSVRKDGQEISEQPAQHPSAIFNLGDDNQWQVTVHENGNYTFKTKQGNINKIAVKTLHDPLELKGSWEVRFPFGWGAPSVTTFPELISWTQSEDMGIKYFSGIATYYKKFEIPSDKLNSTIAVELDLGNVKEVAEVYVNGHSLGIVWKPPFTFDITKFVKEGENHIVVEVANLWSNRLTGDAKLPKEERLTSTNMTRSLTWEQPWSETPLHESGLLGPVRILFLEKRTLDF